MDMGPARAAKVEKAARGVVWKQRCEALPI